MLAVRRARNRSTRARQPGTMAPARNHGTGRPTASADGRYSFERARALDMRLLAKLWSQLRALLSDREAAPAGVARPPTGKASGGAAEAAAAEKWRACVPYLVAGAAAAPIEVPTGPCLPCTSAR